MDNVIDIEQFRKPQGQTIYENNDGESVPDLEKKWSVRDIAKSILASERAWLNATSAVAGAYAVESVRIENEADYCYLLMTSEKEITPIEVVRELAQELTDDIEDEGLDIKNTYFSALGCFAYEFIARKCFIHGGDYAC